MSAVRQVWVPLSFWLDHADRCPCDGDPEAAMARGVRKAGSRMLIEGDAAQLECLRSDAAYYCDTWGPDEAPASIVRSARRTVAALGVIS